MDTRYCWALLCWGAENRSFSTVLLFSTHFSRVSHPISSKLLCRRAEVPQRPLHCQTSYPILDHVTARYWLYYCLLSFLQLSFLGFCSTILGFFLLHCFPGFSLLYPLLVFLRTLFIVSLSSHSTSSFQDDDSHHLSDQRWFSKSKMILTSVHDFNHCCTEGIQMHAPAQTSLPEHSTISFSVSASGMVCLDLWNLVLNIFFKGRTLFHFWYFLLRAVITIGITP